ncbi:hypothetical protein Tco_1172841 [Tanacetum coccineum]
MATPSPSPPISLSPPSAGERLARCMAQPAHSPPLLPSSRYEVGESSTARPSRGRGIDYEFVSMVDSEERQQELEILRVRIRDTRNNRSRISQLVDMDSQRVDLLMGDRMTLQETVWMVEEEAYASREAWAYSIGLSSSDTATAVEFSHSDITSDESWHLRPEEDTGPARRSYTRHTGATSRGAHTGGADGPKI